MSTGYIRSVTSRNAGGGRKYFFNNVSKKPYWTQRADIPTARIGASGQPVNGKIYVIGGYYNSFSRYKVNECYDPSTDTWSTKADIPSERESYASAAVDGKIYIIGGVGEINTNKNECYDPVTNTWSTKENAPYASRAATASVVDGKIYMMGGYAGGDSAANYCYDPVTNTWSTKANMPKAIRYPVSFAHNNNVHVFTSDTTRLHYVYNTVTNTYSTSVKIPFVMVDTGIALVIGDKAYIFLGNDFYIFNLTENLWSQIEPPSSVIVRLPASVVDGKIYILGDYLYDPLKTTQCYDPEAGIPSIEIHGENLINLDKKSLLNNVEIQGKTTVDAGKKSILYLIEDNTTGTVEPIGDIVVG